MSFRTYIFLDNRKSSVKFQGHRSKVKITKPDFQTCNTAR